MAKPFREQVTQEQVAEQIRKHHGIIAKIAKEMKVCRNVIYDYIDENPELDELRHEMINRFDDRSVEDGYNVVETLMAMVKDDPANALKAARVVLDNSEKSKWRKPRPGDNEDTGGSYPAEIAAISRRAAEQEKLIAQYERQLNLEIE